MKTYTVKITRQARDHLRALYPDASLADLYDETTMSPEIRRAHRNNDKAVMQAYGFSIRDTTETGCVDGEAALCENLY